MKMATNLPTAEEINRALDYQGRRGVRPVRPVTAERFSFDDMTDEQLFQRYTDGDADGFRVLVERYEPRIQGFLRKRLNDEERVQDLTQDTFLRIHRARDSYDPGRKFSTWIHTIANNLLKNEFRNRSRRRETAFSEIRPDTSASGAPSRPVEFAATGADPEREAYRSELREAIDTAIERMDEHHRIPFVMREVEDRTYEEIAEAIGIPVGTVKSRLNRARNAFRMLLPVPV
ncbi:MAG TPA: sigma-70 family RNA polymerase sigma factor [Longimicrobiaceae bacterium]|nr:sigma-70 family RNA polymerase sigma factor [Longimicrobiaceae bacterium]